METFFFLGLLLIALRVSVSRSSPVTSNLRNVSAILDELLESYDRYHRPSYGGKHQVPAKSLRPV